MSSNYFNQIVRNNIPYKPIMFSKTSKAVMKAIGPKTIRATATEEDSRVLENKTENKGPIRQCKSYERSLMVSSASPKKRRTSTAKSMRSVGRSDHKAKTAKPVMTKYEPNGSKLLKAVMALSDNSVNQLQALNKKMVQLGFVPTKSNHIRRNGSSGSVLSGSSSRRYQRARARTQLCNYLTQSFSTHSLSASLVNLEPPRNQQMSASWATKTADIDSSMRKSLMPVNHDVRNLISVSTTPLTPREMDPMYNWNHPPSPSDYKMNLSSVIDSASNGKELQNGRLRLLSKHSSWENHMRAAKSVRSTHDPTARYLPVTNLDTTPRSYLPTDDPNAILDKPIKKDLSSSLPQEKPKEYVKINQKKVESYGATRKAVRVNSVADTLKKMKSWNINHNTNSYKPELLRVCSAAAASRYSHASSLHTKKYQ